MAAKSQVCKIARFLIAILRKAIHRRCHTVEAINRKLGTGSGDCNGERCHPKIKAMIEEFLKKGWEPSRFFQLIGWRRPAKNLIGMCPQLNDKPSAGLIRYGLFYWFYSEVFAYFSCKTIVYFSMAWYRWTFILIWISPPRMTTTFSNKFTALFA